ncbi:MAG: HypC/HybG/HupF family hydrogenase formation chaperone [Candidatus Aminicenantes bacterium]|nr:HypC/HybG/HupF family hydrogenase formation chaperone [Candidatus Aminicenantes bacterium]RLE02351.1 MAG: HypC/HybG/HupF family hydrogenase formation chaperone [Candidatus Aminicenantes bacterium]
MCLGIPAKVIELAGHNRGKADYLGTKIQVDFSLLENVNLNDWVIVHAGFAIAKLNEEEAAETFELLREYARFLETLPSEKEKK